MIGSDLWSGAAGVGIGTLLGTAIPFWREWRRRRVERRGDIISMMVELRFAALALEELRTSDIATPLFRLPITMFERAVPKLVGEGLLSINEHAALIEYINRIEELNRGLDQAGGARAAGRELYVAEEFARNREKAEGFFKVEKRLVNQSLFDAAMDTVFRLDEQFSPVEVALPWGALPCEVKIPRLWLSSE